MKSFFWRILLGFTIAAALCSCRAGRPAPDTPSPLSAAAPVAAPLAVPARRDSAVVQPGHSTLDKLLGRTPAPTTYVGQLSIRAGKRSTVNYYAGPARVQTSTSTVGKKGSGAAGPTASAATLTKPKAPAKTGPGDFTNQAGATNAAAVKGDHNALQQHALPPAPKLTAWQRFTQGVARTWRLVRWPLAVLAAAAAVGAVLLWLFPASGASVWLLAWWKRRKSTPSS